MTVLVGLRCKDGAVLACDSQETRANYFRFWGKTNVVGDRFVVMYAGNPTLAEAFSRRLDSRIRNLGNERLDKARACELIEEVLFSMAKEVGEEAVKGRQILIAGVADDGICLWAVDSGEIYLREMRTWECYGSGTDAAEMLMKDFYFPQITVQQAIPLLIYVIHAVSEICIDCGGPVNVVVVNDSGIKHLESEQVEEKLRNIKPLLDRLRKELPKQVIKGKVNMDGL